MNTSYDEMNLSADSHEINEQDNNNAIYGNPLHMDTGEPTNSWLK